MRGRYFHFRLEGTDENQRIVVTASATAETIERAVCGKLEVSPPWLQTGPAERERERERARAALEYVQMTPGTFFFTDERGDATTIEPSDAIEQYTWSPSLPIFTVRLLSSGTGAVASIPPRPSPTKATTDVPAPPLMHTPPTADR